MLFGALTGVLSFTNGSSSSIRFIAYSYWIGLSIFIIILNMGAIYWGVFFLNTFCLNHT